MNHDGELDILFDRLVPLYVADEPAGRNAVSAALAGAYGAGAARALADRRRGERMVFLGLLIGLAGLFTLVVAWSSFCAWGPR